jgi:hypothetical protein
MEGKLRLPAVAGQFYPGEKVKLERTIEDFLDKVEAPVIEGEVFGLLLPHAGYLFSGLVAAHGVKAIIGKDFDTVIIIGDSHYERFDGVSIWPEGFWETPLSRLEIDNELAHKIIAASDRFLMKDSTHLFEHSIEVQLPFLQKTLKKFKILPIIFGSEDEDWQSLAKAILENIKDRKVLIIASADLSHYLSYEKAREIDQKTLENIINLQTQDLEVCAIDSVKTLIEITKSLGGKAKLLKYLNSGDTAGDKSQVVGYGAVVFYR